MSALLDLLPTLSVGWPLALWGLLACPLLVLLALGSRFALSPQRRWLATATRVVALALVVLAVADLRIGWRTDELAVAVVMDESDSIAPEEREALGRELTQMQAAHPEVPIRVIGAGAQGRSSDPATQLSAAVALLPRDHVRRVLLATDGRDPSGRLASAVEAAREEGVEVSIASMGSMPSVDGLSIAALEAPRLVHAEETLDVAATVHSDAGGEVRLEVFLDGRSVATATHAATRGDSSARVGVRFPTEPGVHELEVAVSGAGDLVAANDRWRSLVEVLPKPRVRLYHDASTPEPALATVLRDAGMEVELATAREAFTSAREYDRYALVIADEMELGDLSEAQQQAIRTWVEDEGGGLISITGNHPVRRTPRILREIEPIMPPPALPEPRPLELVIIIDRSSSMSGYPMEQARRSGVAAVRALRRDARVGSVAFSSGADRVIAPVPMDRADEVTRFISGLNAAGGTNIGAAIQAANHIIETPLDPRYIHHVILISDGESDPPAAIAAAMALAGRGVSISTITIGPYSQLLAEIARIGRGRYHTTSAAGLQSLVVSEAMYRQPPAARQTSFRPREVTHLTMLDGIDWSSAPTITGHALAQVRPGATVVLSATDGMPLLAHWHRGLGQVATYTSASSGSWADQLRQWDGYRQLWTQLARGMRRTRTIEPPRIAIEPHPVRDGVRVVTVVSPFVAADPLPVVRLFRDRGEPVPMRLAQVGPGTWQSELPAGFTFLVDARMPFDHEPTVAAGDEVPYPVELTRFGPDAVALERLAALGGGRVLDAPLGVLEAPTAEVPVMRALRMPMLIVALLLYLLGLLLLRMPDRRLAAFTVVGERVSNAPPKPRASVPPAPPKKSKEAA